MRKLGQDDNYFRNFLGICSSVKTVFILKGGIINLHGDFYEHFCHFQRDLLQYVVLKRTCWHVRELKQMWSEKLKTAGSEESIEK